MVFVGASLVAYLVVVLTALRLRGRFYAAFAAVILGIHTFVAAALFGQAGPSWPVFVYLQAATYLHFFALVWARVRPRVWRYTVALPAMYFVGATFLALPWAVSAAAGFEPWAPWLPFVLALAGVGESIWARESTVDLGLDGMHVRGGRPRRWPRRRARPSDRQARPLCLVQITDPHLGPWMSVRRLRRICARAVEREPDLVLLTGDFLTMETNRSAEALAAALEPLGVLRGRTFACRGNHDLEAPSTVDSALANTGVRLLVDEEAVIETEAGPVQLLGIDHRWSGRRYHVREVCRRHPRRPGALRLVLLHDPGAFKHVPEGDGDLVLSGHTHGGQVGLVTLGLPWTMLRLFVDMPDHGLWARGPDRLYVHRGTGHYGFPLRVGVPAERSMLRVWRG